MAESSIEWTHYTFNPWRGCAKMHTGCANCYAEVNYSVKMHGIKWGTQAQGGTRVKLADNGWKQPLAWNRAAEKAGERRRVFCASLADVFEDWSGPILDHNGGLLGHCRWCGVVWRLKGHSHCARCDRVGGIDRDATLDDLRADLFKLIDRTPNLDWLLLTKRPENARRMWPTVAQSGIPALQRAVEPVDISDLAWPRQNVWLGTSISDQATADEWLPKLLECHGLAPVLFASAEPLVGKIRIRVRDLDWLIIGGESGPKARRCEVEWIRSLVEQCASSHVSAFVKQLGGFVVDRNDAGFDGPDECSDWPEPVDVRHDINGFRENYQGADCQVILRDPKGGDPAEWPEDLRVRQFPASVVAVG